jgi:hypothetical protein
MFAPCNQDTLDEKTPGRACVTDEDELYTALQDLYINLPLMNKYFDESEYDISPLKNSMKFLTYAFNPVLSSNYIMNVKRVNVLRSDSWYLPTTTNNDTFYQIGSSYSYQSTPDGDYYPYVAIYIMMDELVSSINR